MDTLYLVCAVVGGTILAIQTILLLLGLGGDADGVAGHADVHADAPAGDASDAFFKVLSIKTMVGFLAFFGLAGLAGERAGMGDLAILLLALGSGTIALFAVAYAMAGLAKLQSSGNVDLRQAVGAEGRVYLRVPGQNRGQGKVTLDLQGRRIECRAFTAGPEIPTGAQVRVVAVPRYDVVEVRTLS